MLLKLVNLFNMLDFYGYKYFIFPTVFLITCIVDRRLPSYHHHYQRIWPFVAIDTSCIVLLVAKLCPWLLCRYNLSSLIMEKQNGLIIIASLWSLPNNLPLFLLMLSTANYVHALVSMVMTRAIFMVSSFFYYYKFYVLYGVFLTIYHSYPKH